MLRRFTRTYTPLLLRCKPCHEAAADCATLPHPPPSLHTFYLDDIQPSSSFCASVLS
ncbi:hypothetical protein CPB85DRAFT_1286813 [Mucidula mucida]|nr:hypothetical protein CPB85DRAFT_1286813 [Mucidula mucida]